MHQTRTSRLSLDFDIDLYSQEQRTSEQAGLMVSMIG